jgi:hypothetical protein
MKYLIICEVEKDKKPIHLVSTINIIQSLSSLPYSPLCNLEVLEISLRYWGVMREMTVLRSQ